MSAWGVTNPTSDAVAQQAAALSQLAASAPDQLTDDAKAQAVDFSRNLLRNVDATDTSSINSILSTIGSLAGQAAEDAARASIPVARRRLASASGMRLGGREEARLLQILARRASEAAETAQQFITSTNDAIVDISGTVLGGASPGEDPVNFTVSDCALQPSWRVYFSS